MKYRIAILTDSDFLQAWEWECLNAIIQQGNAEIVLDIRNLSPKPAGKKSGFLYRAYRALDRRIFKSAHDAFSYLPLSNLPISSLLHINVIPIQTLYRDELQSADLDTIREFKLDIILRFGFRILTGELLTLPRLGVWSFHHGDPAFYRGGPPAFWEVMLGWETTGTVLQRLTEKLDQGDVLYQSCSHTDPLSVQRNANSIFWKSAYFVSRVLNSIAQLGEEKWAEKLATQKNKSPLRTPPGNLQMIALFWDLISRNMWRKIQEKRKPAHWELAFVNHTDPTTIKASDVSLIAHADNSKSYLADPFPSLHKGKTYVFAEKYDKQSKKGSIVCGRMEGNTLHDLQTVIVEDWHLSYPSILEEDGVHFMIPESASAGKLYFYQASIFPYQWERKTVFFEGEAFDPTLYYADGKWWLFVNEKPHPASSPFDELNLYYCDSLHSLHWNAHPMNPIVSDVRCSRPAGKLFQKDGTLYRPAQDSGKRYGHRIAVQEVFEISETSYHERTAYYINPELIEGALGVHTLNYCKDKMFLDFYFRK
ncbi:formyltransferase family protein [Algoriphagus sp. D3-2-R+10]|uniref:glucosamine inositolphosphorylceramide transferase family protein n=1 Tax=Algoriphagus aurantiacus TaxID=3103948 RepID=UPI002B39FFFF|nr:formyltransferase family protein [Algoriphagus sp. D3-2-R+10]MEB2778309.1 formyltransferase family protein [Algoriphagus sp. D3-2-R+10]